ncbi:MAG: type I DNA topoisomerase [Gammaproteobacteria bacterium]|nr:type I DNA topoisomerase [Gammaproteobacteria bacterium]
MTKNLVIVESPAKAATIKKYLGKDFTVLASYGHVRDLIPKNGAVDTDHDFAMNYDVIERNAKHVTAITKALKESTAFYLATDPDREGEAIAWHICELMRGKKALKKQAVHRVVFHEITKSAVTEAISKPRDISMTLVDAQQARRALDYLVGFNLSPLLWKKIRYGLSAGRVQSPALRMIVTREEEIEKFINQEYWTISSDNSFSKQAFSARLTEYQSKKLTQFSIVNKEQADAIKADLISIAAGKLNVIKVDKKQRKRNPAAPFTTSTLQQEASRKLGFSAKRTMINAQRLYEAGRITYMRTDSVNLAAEAIAETREVIVERFGAKNVPKEPVFYKTKSKNAQEAHEAIRPTSSKLLPEDLESVLEPEQFKLYNLIWRRTIACQMIHATFDTVAIDLSCGDGNVLRANGSVITEPGFLAVYHEDVDDAVSDDDKILPPMKVGDVVDLLEIDNEQHFTEPPPRYSEASLVKTLEEYGIGRPSTYANIIDTLLSREYVILETKRFRPTDVGRVVNKFLTNYFPKYVDYKFTAHLEDELDDIASGKYKFLDLMHEFWGPFKKLIDDIAESVKRSDVTQEALDEKCPKCGKQLTLRLGKKGKFIGCSGYPECDYTANVDNEKNIIETEVVADRVCPECKSPLHIKLGLYGKFIGCSNYPNCKFMEPLEKPADTGVKCPECGEGTMLKRKSRYGKYFYSCERYPKCKYAVWNEPLNEKCPKCGWKILTSKTTKRYGTEKVCPQKECGYTDRVKD